MQKALIKLAYKQTIDASTEGSFEKKVFSDSYSEFLMQIQAYNQENKYTTWQALLSEVPKASSLHYKVGFSIGLYVKDLNNQIPMLQDSLGRTNLIFETHLFEIIESDITNRLSHRVAITYYTDTLTLLDSFGEYLLLAWGDQSQHPGTEPLETFLLPVCHNLSIVSYLALSSR